MSQKASTLIELLVVIAMISILAALLLPALASSTKCAIGWCQWMIPDHFAEHAG